MGSDKSVAIGTPTLLEALFKNTEATQAPMHTKARFRYFFVVPAWSSGGGWTNTDPGAPQPLTATDTVTGVVTCTDCGTGTGYAAFRVANSVGKIASVRQDWCTHNTYRQLGYESLSHRRASPPLRRRDSHRLEDSRHVGKLSGHSGGDFR